MVKNYYEKKNHKLKTVLDRFLETTTGPQGAGLCLPMDWLGSFGRTGFAAFNENGHQRVLVTGLEGVSSSPSGETRMELFF